MVEYKTIGTTKIVYINPMKLKIANPRTFHNHISLSYRNWVNGTFFSMYDSNTWLWAVNQGHQLCYRGAWQTKAMGTLIIWNDGRVEVKRLLDLTKDERRNIHLAIQACDAFPYMNGWSESSRLNNSIKDQGFSYNEIGRYTNRPMIGYNPELNKIIITIRPGSTAYRGYQTLKNLGCTCGLFLDAGGSTNGRWNNKIIARTSRRLGTILYWN